MINLKLFKSILTVLFLFSSQGNLFAFPPSPEEEEAAEGSINACRSPEKKYQLGLKFRNGEIPGFEKDNPLTLSKVIACCLPKAIDDDEKAIHNVAMALMKLKQHDIAYQLFSIAAEKGLEPSKNNKKKMKQESVLRKKPFFIVEPLEGILSQENTLSIQQLIRKHRFLPSPPKIKALEEFVAFHPLCKIGLWVARNQPDTIDEQEFETYLTKQMKGSVNSIYPTIEALEIFKLGLPLLNADIQKKLEVLATTFSDYILNLNLHCGNCLKIGNDKESLWPGRNIALLNNQKDCAQISDILAIYEKEIKPFFKTVQKICNTIFYILSYYNFINPEKNYGIIKRGKHANLAYIKNSEGFIPFACWRDVASLTHHQLPYAMTDSSQQRSVLYDSSEIIASSGLLLLPLSSSGTSLLLAYVGENYTLRHPDNQFVISSTMKKIELNKAIPGGQGQIADLFLSAFTQKELDEFREKNVAPQERISPLFLPLAPCQEDEDLVELLFLENLMEAQKDEKHPDHMQAIEYIKALEEQAQTSIETILEERNQAILTPYEQAIRAEQELISKQVAEHKIHGLKKKKKNKKKRKSKPNRQVQACNSSTSSSNIEERAKKQAEAYKQRGRIKYIKTLSILNQIMHDHPASAFLTANISGSHVIYHGKEEETTPSLVVHHGSEDKTIPASRFNRFTKGLFKLILKQEENQKLLH